jgi:hypothetical protein
VLVDEKEKIFGSRLLAVHEVCGRKVEEIGGHKKVALIS